MIKFIRSARVEAGKVREAAQWAREVADWINARQPDANVQVYREVFGAAGTLYWISEAADVAMLERQTAEWQATPEWQALMARNAGLLVAGSVQDTVLRSI